MEVGVQRTDSQRLQANGPRVSFNRDVHVKRIGKRPNETADYPIQTTNLQPPQTYQLRRELPADLSEESILKEAALVLAQAESVRCTAAGGSEIVGGRLNEKSRGKIQRPVPNKFHSLPSRKKNPKPITRSVSDASSKKPKKPSIFNIFSRKSDPNLDQIEPDRRFKEGGGRRLIRSKSDASPTRDRKYLRKKLSDNEESLSPSKPVQLSPIIENTQKEDYFEKITAKSKNEEKPKEEKPKKESSDEPKLKDSSPTKKSETKLPPGNIGYTSHEDLDLIPAKPVGDGLKDTLTSLALHSQSLEDMHSSQLPQEKPPLTKGVTVDGMVKRLSMERFSPPPHISGPAFSYTRPNEQIIYAQVVCDSDGRPRHEDLQPKEMDSSYRYQTNGYDHRSAIERNNYTTSQKKSEVYIGDNYGTQYRSYSPPQVTRIRGTQSPTYLKQSPRNLSDEDEGLGFEPRKYFEDDLPSSTPSKLRGNTLKTTDYERSKSPSYDPPIIPVIRSLSPIEVKVDADRGRADGMDSRRKEPFSEFNNLSYRREALESKIKSRRIGSVDRRTGSPVNLTYRYSPERSREYKKEFEDEQTNRYLSPDRDQKFHKLDSREIINKYSPERTHLDMVSPNKDLKTSKFTHTKYYDDGTGGVKEIYQKETRVDEHGQPHTRESRRRERLDSPRRSKERENGYSNGHAEKYRVEYEPKSLDSQFSEVNRSSPENVKRTEVTRQRHEEQWQDSLKRDKRQQRSFDKGDSGIENDFRKESFNGEFTSKWRKRTYLDDIKSCELFIKKERRHTEELHPQRKKYDFVYRERSIDDGSHFDPRLDKYPKGTLKKKDDPVSYSSPGKEAGGTLKREKKIGSLEKVKKLFSSGRKKENKEVNGKKEPGKDHYMVKEEEMRSRYHEYRGVMADLREPNVPDIATRRRLSTPKASPLLKRTSSEKTTKPSPLSLRNGEETTKAEKSGWFKSLDRRSKKKANEKLGSSFRTSATTTEDEISTIRSKEKYRTPIAPPLPEKNLRFFGDTDIDSNPSMSKAASNQRIRPSVATLSKNQKYSQSAYHLDKISKQQHGSKSTPRSNSMQNLEEGFDEVDRPRRRQHSRSRNLDDISESASDTEVARETRQSSAAKTPARDSNVEYSKHRYEEHAVRRSHERDSRTPHRESSDTTRIEFRKPPPGPPKPARSVERTPNYATLNVRDRERLHDSSGTEGESSLHSQRSVVYLHATTIGAIPQPYHLSPRRRAMSREELRSKHKNQQQQQQQPMTRTVSRSVSMLAPWKPKHLHDGYEINYSQDATDKSRKISTMPRKQQSSSSSSKNKKNDATLRPRKYASSKDDLSSTRNSSLTSASKSGLSSNHRTLEKKSSSKETLSRRRAK